MRRVFRTKWHRYSCSKGRLRQISDNFESHSVEIAHGAFILRHTMISTFRRKAMIRWLSWIANVMKWEKAGLLMHRYLRRRIFKQWIAHFRAVRGFRVGESSNLETIWSFLSSWGRDSIMRRAWSMSPNRRVDYWDHQRSTDFLRSLMHHFVQTRKCGWCQHSKSGYMLDLIVQPLNTRLVSE